MKPFIPFITLSLLIAPCYAGELDNGGPSTQFYVRVPLGASAPKERMPSYGLAIRGRQDHQVFTLDSRMLEGFSFDGGFGGIDAKWLLVGGAAAATAIAVSRKGGGGPSSGPSKEGTPPPAQGTPPTQQGNQGAPPPPSNCPQACAKVF